MTSCKIHTLIAERNSNGLNLKPSQIKNGVTFCKHINKNAKILVVKKWVTILVLITKCQIIKSMSLAFVLFIIIAWKLRLTTKGVPYLPCYISDYLGCYEIQIMMAWAVTLPLPWRLGVAIRVRWVVKFLTRGYKISLINKWMCSMKIAVSF